MSTKSPQVKDEVFFVASFNDWVPMRMKSMRQLLVERFPMDYPIEDFPQHALRADNVVLNYADMIPTGFHYFYFAREKGEIFLSPKYEVVRFKQTNTYLNRIRVSRRLEDIETVHQAKDGEELEAVFMKDRSVFRDYREDTTAFLQKCFDEDWGFGKIIKTINKKLDVPVEEQALKDILF